MLFEGRDVPEDEFRALARRIFWQEMAIQDQQIADAKAQKWVTRDPHIEQQMFDKWMRDLGVKPFPLIEPRWMTGIVSKDGQTPG